MIPRERLDTSEVTYLLVRYYTASWKTPQDMSCWISCQLVYTYWQLLYTYWHPRLCYLESQKSAFGTIRSQNRQYWTKLWNVRFILYNDFMWFTRFHWIYKYYICKFTLPWCSIPAHLLFTNFPLLWRQTILSLPLWPVIECCNQFHFIPQAIWRPESGREVLK